MLGSHGTTLSVIFLGMVPVTAAACIFNLKKIFLYKVFTKIFIKLILVVTQLIMKLTAGSDYTMALVQ